MLGVQTFAAYEGLGHMEQLRELILDKNKIKQPHALRV